MKLGKELWAGLFGEDSGSRKAEALVAGCVAAYLVPELAWPVTAMTGAYILGRALHDAAMALSDRY